MAKISHFPGILGILGTGIYCLVKRNDVGTFVRDQMKEAFKFQMVVSQAGALFWRSRPISPLDKIRPQPTISATSRRSGKAR